MNYISNSIKFKANIQAIYLSYIYLSDKTIPSPGSTLKDIVAKLEENLKAKANEWSKRRKKALSQIKNAVKSNPIAANSRLLNLTYKPSGMTAGVFFNETNSLSFVYRGTGDGEWIDNSDGISGMERENTYFCYDFENKKRDCYITLTDYATGSQVEALNWFNNMLMRIKDRKDFDIVVSGHSKGGNKAQFVTLCSPYVNECYSFNGQGFSPEAVRYFEKSLGADFEQRRKKIKGICADNDYVNVFGKSIIPGENTFYFESENGIHDIGAILNKNGMLKEQVKQGRLSEYLENISNELMSLNQNIRKSASSALMKIFEKYLGNGLPVQLSVDEIITALGVSAELIFKTLRN